MITYVIEGINPEPWTSPEASVGRKNGRYISHLHSPEQMKVYQKALAAEFNRWLVDKWEGDLFVQFEFSRQVAEFETELGKKSYANYADATNLQKSTEDALQGILFDNDRQVKRICTEVIEQGPDVEPLISIRIERYVRRQNRNTESEEVSVLSQMARQQRSRTENVLPADRDIF
jgi:Holliday junction resolvase RusA-like endonuclease